MALCATSPHRHTPLAQPISAAAELKAVALAAAAAMHRAPRMCEEEGRGGGAIGYLPSLRLAANCMSIVWDRE